MLNTTKPQLRARDGTSLEWPNRLGRPAGLGPLMNHSTDYIPDIMLAARGLYKPNCLHNSYQTILFYPVMKS